MSKFNGRFPSGSFSIVLQSYGKILVIVEAEHVLSLKALIWVAVTPCLMFLCYLLAIIGINVFKLLQDYYS